MLVGSHCNFSLETWMSVYTALSYSSLLAWTAAYIVISKVLVVLFSDTLSQYSSAPIYVDPLRTLPPNHTYSTSRLASVFSFNLSLNSHKNINVIRGYLPYLSYIVPHLTMPQAHTTPFFSSWYLTLGKTSNFSILVSQSQTYTGKWRKFIHLTYDFVCSAGCDPQRFQYLHYIFHFSCLTIYFLSCSLKEIPICQTRV